ncbi:MAG: aminoacyl-tRNA hydrolase [Phycisphaeraceae bacterium]|nr:aminoacyl-tRNA hydrolase [Phycisphaeraceae bacterium]
MEIAPGVYVPSDALVFSFSRSGGPGGQNVNKRSTKAELRVFLADLPITPAAAGRLVASASRMVSEAGHLIITCDQNRSQERNRAECLDRLRKMVRSAIPEPRVRRKTRPTAGSQARRLEGKKRDSAIKRSRKGPGSE